MKLAAGLLIAAVLVATGWAAEKVYQMVGKKSVILEEEVLVEERSEPIKLADGISMLSGRKVGRSVRTFLPEDAPPGAVEKAKENLEEIKQLIARKKYEFVTTFEGASGTLQYIYRFTLADGEKHAMNFSMPLEDVASWEDYRQKCRERAKLPEGALEKAARENLEEIKQLIAQKKYEFGGTFEGASGQLQYWYRFTLSDGKKHGMNFSMPLDDVASWEDYLQKAREQVKQRQE
jgi:Fe-S oxidoreductase